MTKMTREEVERAVSRSQSLIDEDLSGIDLSRIDLSDANIEGAELLGSDLSHTDLRRANLKEADLRQTDLRYTNLSEANLSRASLSKANLIGVDLSGANLRYTKLTNANLSGVEGIISAELGQHTIIANKSTFYDCKSGIIVSVGGASYPLELWLGKIHTKRFLINGLSYTDKESERYYEFILSIERMLND